MIPPISRSRRIIALTGAILFAVGVIALVAWGTNSSQEVGTNTFNNGAIVGSGVVIASIGVLTALRRSGTQAGRLISGNTDERERAIKNQALAHAAIGMIVATALCEIGALYGMPALAFGGVVATVGVVTVAVSAILQARRG